MPDTMTLLPRSRSRNGARQASQELGAMNPVPNPRPRRRPLFLVMAVAMCALAIVFAVTLVNKKNDRQDVLVLAKDIQQGHVITAADLATVHVNTDAGLHVVLAADQARVVGKTVSTNLPEGTLLNPSSLTDGVLPPKGKSLVGITVALDKLPATALMPGDMVQLVDTPRDQDSSPVQAPTTSNAQVVQVRPLSEGQSGQVTVDVLVPDGEANWVAGRAATHRVAIVLQTRER
ncbi:SAF domain-containing protein [Nocardia transvalensis]|uniref:SAF domain-containing protein n=1 Tax=Nocardia transvalensis TaxID=37333 RepID=UPI0018931D8F|nr:SAF domain-containing protein [Nocardia transvalensis]MBF6333630.1 flagella basal body P-ring formation protein FlgA [Nocardia transvalensis]